MSELQHLRDRVADLEAALGVTGELQNDLLFLSGRLSRRGRQVLGILLMRQIVIKVAAYDVIYGDLPEVEQPDTKVIDTWIFHVRRALKPYGIAIETRWGEGYLMTEPNKKKLRQLIEQSKADAA